MDIRQSLANTPLLSTRSPNVSVRADVLHDQGPRETSNKPEIETSGMVGSASTLTPDVGEGQIGMYAQIGGASPTARLMGQVQKTINAQAQDHIASMARFLEMLHEGAPFEVRALNVGHRGIVSGIFTDPSQAAYAVVAAGLERDGATGVYVTLNPLSPAGIARFPYHRERLFSNVPRTTRDRGILRRRWLMLDFDPKRPDNVSSTEEESQAAISRACQARNWLTERGWPEPLVIGSGNGAHLLYRVDLPNDKDSHHLVRNVLHGLAQYFTDSAVALDCRNHNAARITKLVGTLACKGAATEERPHRRAQLLSAPDEVTVVAQTLLEEAAALPLVMSAAPIQIVAQRVSQSATSATYHIADVADWLTLHGVAYRDRSSSNGARRFELEKCPWANHADLWKAWVLQRTDDGRIFAGCHADKCDGKSFRDLRALLEPVPLSPTHLRVHASGAEKVVAEVATPVAAVTSGLDEPCAPPQWPQLDPIALYGLAGDIVRLIEPHTEADPVALLVQLLLYFGNAVGNHAFVRVEAQRHFGNEFAVLVGATAKARKGTSEGWVESVFTTDDAALEEWRTVHFVNGLTSGEGLIHAVRDLRQSPDEGTSGNYEWALAKDKRVLVRESEFGATLRVMGREGNSLSGVLRDAWDGRTLQTLGKRAPEIATGAHVSIIGHVTHDELKRYLSATEQSNGFGNRFLWACVRRSKFLPLGGALADSALTPYRIRLARAVDAAQRISEVKRDDAALELWCDQYMEMSVGGLGTFGKMTDRGEAHVLRLSLLYALLDRSTTIRRAHLEAALGLWQYCEDSARYLFGDGLSDPFADKIMRELEAAGAVGLTRTEINHIPKGHASKEQIDRALDHLRAAGRAIREIEPTTGRSVERWRAAKHAE